MGVDVAHSDSWRCDRRGSRPPPTTLTDCDHEQRRSPRPGPPRPGPVSPGPVSSPGAVPDGERLAMLAALVDGDIAFADHLVRGLLADGIPFVEIAREVLSPVQREVGRRWAEGALGVADEHAASVAVEHLLATLSIHDAEPDGPTVVVASPDQESHGLGCRVVACALSIDGCRVLNLGAWVPIADLAEFLDQHRPTALALSVSLTSALTSAARTIATAHAVGVPVVAGGQAIESPGRAQALGADAFADLGTVVDVVMTWHAAPPTSLAPDLADIPEHDELARRSYLLVGNALEAVGGDAGAHAARGEDLRRLLLVAEGALLLDEPTLVADFRSWMVEAGPAHGISVEAIDEGIAALAAQLEHGLPRVHALLARR